MTIFSGKGAPYAKNLYNLFYDELRIKYFIIKQVFRKNNIFGKTVKNHLWKDMTDRFEGKGRLLTKINVTFFVGKEILNIFHSTIFSKKTIFFKITAKITWS